MSTDIHDLVFSLSRLKQIAFAASCCERLLPNYLAFSVEEGWGDYMALKQSTDRIWSYLIDGHSEPFPFIDLDKLIQLVPDTEEFTSVFTALAGDAVSATVYTLEGCNDESTIADRLKLVLEVTENSIFEYLVAVNDPDVEAHIDNPSFIDSVWQFPLMVSEQEKQMRDAKELQGTSVLDRAFLTELKASSGVSGIQPLKRGLVNTNRNIALRG
jgi:uncharacterized protein YjaG (DUF416 family)